MLSSAIEIEIENETNIDNNNSILITDMYIDLSKKTPTELLSLLKNPVYEFVINKFANKFKNIKKSINENTLFSPKPLKPLKSSLSSSSSPTKRINILEVDNICNYDNLLEQATFISKTLWNLSSIKVGLLRLTGNATRCR